MFQKIGYVLLIGMLALGIVSILGCDDDSSNDSNAGSDEDSEGDGVVNEECDEMTDHLTNECGFSSQDIAEAQLVCSQIGDSLGLEYFPEFTDCVIAEECSTWEDDATAEAAMQACIDDIIEDIPVTESHEELMQVMCEYKVACDPSTPTMEICIAMLDALGYTDYIILLSEAEAAAAIPCIPSEPTCTDEESAEISACLEI